MYGWEGSWNLRVYVRRNRTSWKYPLIAVWQQLAVQYSTDVDDLTRAFMQVYSVRRWRKRGGLWACRLHCPAPPPAARARPANTPAVYSRPSGGATPPVARVPRYWQHARSSNQKRKHSVHPYAARTQKKGKPHRKNLIVRHINTMLSS